MKIILPCNTDALTEEQKAKQEEELKEKKKKEKEEEAEKKKRENEVGILNLNFKKVFHKKEQSS